jgi:hypothetical protein
MNEQRRESWNGLAIVVIILVIGVVLVASAALR